MKIGEPTFVEPSSSESLQRANAVERALLECEIGQWLPVEVDRASHAMVLVKILKERGYTVKRTRLVVNVKAPESARPHVHKLVYPPGVTDATKVEGRCPCGFVKPPSDNNGA